MPDETSCDKAALDSWPMADVLSAAILPPTAMTCAAVNIPAAAPLNEPMALAASPTGVARAPIWVSDSKDICVAVRLLANLFLLSADMPLKSSLVKAALDSRAMAEMLSAPILAPMASTWAAVNFAAAVPDREPTALVALPTGAASVCIWRSFNERI